MAKKKYYPEPLNDSSLKNMEESILEFWNKNNIFEKSIKNREKESKDNDFVFFDGPPFANGMPHYGHILSGYIKDTIARYKTMKGKRVLRQFGWDCHGLPAEMNAEKALGISGKKAIEEYGIDKFNEFCKSDALRFASEWKKYVNRSGRWVDFENGYKTMNLDYMESVIHVFKELYDKGLIYEDFRVMPYSWKCQTPLSNAETKMDNSYREKVDKAVTVKFKLCPCPLDKGGNHEVIGGFSNNNNKTNFINYNPELTKKARELRNNQTPFEKKMWYDVLSNKKFEQLKWTRQKPIDNYIVDFYCSELMLAIEIDGDNHYQDKQAEYDNDRTKVLNKLGIEVIRYTNLEIKDSLEWVFEDLSKKVEERRKNIEKNSYSSLTSQSLRDFPPYQEGRGEDVKETSQSFPCQDGRKNCVKTSCQDCVKNNIETSQSLRDFPPYQKDRGEEAKKTSQSLCDLFSCQEGKNIYILAWTTTPWTLPSNLALTVNKEIDYVLLKKDDDYFIIGEPLLNKYKKELAINEKGEFDIISKFKGEKLLGLHYEPLFPYLANLNEVKNSKNCFSIIHGDFVTTTDGTGIVHTAPGFGEDDNNVCKPMGIPTVCPVDDGGCFTDIVSDYKGQQVFETNDAIIIRLKQENKWLKTEQYIHNYPHCWRTDTPLIYRAISSWYVKVESIKEKLLKNNELINWMPDHLKHGRFGKWLEGARDWSISRNRYFGCPIPIWKSTDPKYPRIDVYGSIAELEKDFGVKVTDLHRPYIDRLTRKNPDDPTGKSMMVRVPEVLDCWFESGSMPYAQLHYPFENKEFFEKNFPADFITEGDQTRGWFYTLTVLATALFDKPAFKNVISYGNIVGENGKKLSKRLKNYVDPYEAFNTYGSDAIRWLLLRSPVIKCEEFAISQDGKDMKEILRTCIKPILNSYNFFCLYANSDGIKAEKSFNSKNVMDIYILSKLKETVENVEKNMDNYEVGNACHEIENFFEILNNWYIRRNKNRFWKSEIDQDKQDAYNTLYTVLIIICESMASLLPFTSEYIWKGLSNSNN